MSRSTVKDPAKSKSSETFFKVLRFIGRYRFLLILSIVLAAEERMTITRIRDRYYHIISKFT